MIAGFSFFTHSNAIAGCIDAVPGANSVEWKKSKGLQPIPGTGNVADRADFPNGRNPSPTFWITQGQTADSYLLGEDSGNTCC